MLNLDKEKYKPDNFLTEEEAIKLVEQLKKQGKKVGLCTGSWDLLHPGHITHFESAKKFCDVLIVGVARNEYSSSKYPESRRPIYSDDIRAFMVSKLKPVDYVVFENGEPEFILKIKPDVYIKGSDYANLKNPNEVDAPPLG